MKVDIQDVLFWMDAIRNSEDRYRTLESFWKGQVNSKVWLIENLERLSWDRPLKVVIHGGWNGVLASLLFNSNLDIEHITSVDIDPNCQEVAFTVNKRQEMAGRFSAVTCDMCDFRYNDVPDIVINTSCEHITPEQYSTWLGHIPKESTIVLQSNNYYDLEEHVNCKDTLGDFIWSTSLSIESASKLELPKYTRFMVVGKKHHTT